MQTEIWLEKYPGRKPFSASWVITAPWAHLVWNQYLLMLYDLTTPTNKPPVVYLPGATHEFTVNAVDPREPPLVRSQKLADQRIVLLRPPNYGYQFIAANDEDAMQRIARVMALIRAGQLSPDTDYRTYWNNLFSDAYSLKKQDH